MRVLVDANILIDALVDPHDRPQGDRAAATRLLDAVASKEVTGVITPVIFTFLVHFAKPRHKEHRQQMERALDFILDIFEWAPVEPEHFRTALASSFKDVEDGMEFFSANALGRLDAIITRNTADFDEHVNVPAFTATKFVAKFLR